MKSGQFVENLKWKNTGNKNVVSFELITLKFDPFNRRMIGSRMVVPGHPSADWSPLPPNGEGEDGMLEIGTEHVFTAIAYISAVPYGDGTVWLVDPAELRSAVKQTPLIFEKDSDLQADKPLTK